jgi:hypothetical protein
MKLTSTMLKTIVTEELQKIVEAKKTETKKAKAKEVDAKDMANTLEKQFDFAKALGLEEVRLTKRLKRIQEQRKAIMKRLSGE